MNWTQARKRSVLMPCESEKMSPAFCVDAVADALPATKSLSVASSSEASSDLLRDLIRRAQQDPDQANSYQTTIPQSAAGTYAEGLVR